MEPHYTVLRIATALGLSRQAVWKVLGSIPPDGQILTSGNITKAWRFHSLPDVWKTKLRGYSKNRGYRSVDDMLNAPTEKWEPGTPMAQIDRRWIQNATLLQRALQPSLNRLGDPAIKPGEAETLGLGEYEQVFGYKVSSRHWRRLLARTLERDRGNCDFGRLEIYLDERGTATSAPIAPKKNSYRFPELEEIAGQLRDRTRPTPVEKLWLLTNAFKSFEQLHAAHPKDEREVKAALSEFLLSRVPGLASSADSLRWTFNKKYRKWIEGSRKPGAIEDGRTTYKERPYQFGREVEIVASLALEREGNIAGAYYAAYQGGLLSKEFSEHYPYNPRKNKSRVPKDFFLRVEADYLLMLPASRGPKTERRMMPRPRRDWSNVFPGDQFEADDLTVNFYYMAPDPKTGIARPMRGECLCMADRRSRKILDFLLIADHYNSEDICALMLKVHDRFGFPRDSYVFENGTWKARLIKGDKGTKAMAWSFTDRSLLDEGVAVERAEITTGPEACGVKVHTALAWNPQTKIIEGIFNSVQNLMASFPGFVGRNERLDRYDRTQSLIARARSGDIKSQGQLYTFEESVRALEEIFWRYNNTPQNGQMLEGRTPEEVWQECIAQRPLVKLHDDARWKLASSHTEATPRADGIHATIRGKTRIYASEETKDVPRNKPLNALYNIERQDQLYVLHNGKWLLVPELEISGRGATRDDFNRVRGVQRAYIDASRRRFSEVKSSAISTVTRDTDHEAAKEIGRKLNSATEQADQGRREQSQILNAIKRELEEMGRRFDREAISDPAEYLEALKFEKTGWEGQ